MHCRMFCCVFLITFVSISFIPFISNNAFWYVTRYALSGDCMGGRMVVCCLRFGIESSWNVMAHGDAREGKWRGNWWMEWVASTLHTTSEHAVSSIITADAHTSAASSRLNWRPRRLKWTRPFRRKTKSCFYACAITFQTQSSTPLERRLAVRSLIGTPDNASSAEAHTTMTQVVF
jgi:hypothetical protein